MKTKCFTLLLAGLCVVSQAQTPPGSSPAPTTNDTKASEQALRELLRRDTTGFSNVIVLPPDAPTQPPAAAGVTNIPAPVAIPAAPPVAIPAALPADVQVEPVSAAEPAEAAAELLVPNPAVRPAAKATPPPEELMPAATINWTGAELTQVLQIYAGLLNRTILRAPNLNAPPIVLQLQTPLTKREAIQALDAVLGMSGIAMIPIGEKFIKAVPIAQADTEGGARDPRPAEELPELGQYVTHVVQVKTAKPSELVPVLQQFGKTKSILAVDSSQILVIRDYTENVKRMLEMIAQIDVAPVGDFISEVIPIKYAQAADISAALNSLGGGGGGTSVGGRTSGGPSGGTGARPTTATRTGYGAGAGGVPAPGATPAGTPSSTSTFSERLQSIIRRASSSTGSGDLQILGTTKIIADERTNSLLIFATREDMKMIKDIVAKLDVVLAQVLIESIIMEVSLDDSKNLGISAVQQPHQFGSDVSGLGGYYNGQPFFGGGSSNTFPGNMTSILPNGAGKSFSYWAKFGDDFNVALQAAQTDSRINVLARPRVQTSHGVEAHLFIGQTVPYMTGTTYGDFSGVSSRSSYSEKQIGITLSVKPLINPDGLVVMDIAQDIGQRGADVIIDGNPVPIINQRQAEATVAVKNRETVILGGFISNTRTKSDSGVPIFKDLPLLGPLFRSSSSGTARVELIVLLRPTVLPTPEAAALTARAEQDNMPGIKRAEFEFRKDQAAELKKVEKYKLENP